MTRPRVEIRAGTRAEPDQALIEVEGVCVEYLNEDRWVRVVDHVSFSIRPGEALGLVGESGCGKTTTAYTLLGYNRPNSRIQAGRILFHGRDLLRLKSHELRRVRGMHVSLVPQNPTTALSPGIRVGEQVVETLLDHKWCAHKGDAFHRTLELFRLVHLPAPERIYLQYPHQLSGGQQQRVVIAMALACNPELVVLDEPTTGLDVTTQAQILDLLADLRSRIGMAMLYVTHNLGVVARICDRIAVMYAGGLVEVATRRELFDQPRHPYTQGLIASVPRLRQSSRRRSLLLRGLLVRGELPSGCQFAPRCEFAKPRCQKEPQALTTVGEDHLVACWRYKDVPTYRARLASSELTAYPPTTQEAQVALPPLLAIHDLRAAYGYSRSRTSLHREPKIIVNDVSFEIDPGETLALVGESGSGKTTIARALNGFLPYVSGDLLFDSEADLRTPVGKRSRELLRSIQLVFQNPDASLNPRQRVSQIISRPIEKFFGLSGGRLQARVGELLEDVRLDEGFARRFPDELSGGERQRVALARALAANPRLLLCDEILSALDVSVQANIIELLADLQAKRSLAYLFISHDLAVVRWLAHRVGVLYWGSLCEIGDVEEVFRPPFHPYTYLLLGSVPEADPDQSMPEVHKDMGLVTEDHRYPCPFTPRCPWRIAGTCDTVDPPWQTLSTAHALRCHVPAADLLERQT